MIITESRPDHLVQINILLNHGGIPVITPEYLNSDSLALSAFDGDNLIGFLWVGLMASNTVAYIDKFCIHPDYSKKKIGNKLAKEMIKKCKQSGVRECFGVIGHHKYHEKSAMNALKVAMSGHPHNYTYVEGNINYMASELGIGE